ncbi:MAG: hypothetical protein ACXQT4_01225 [Methanotrichaceae archaeon]
MLVETEEGNCLIASDLFWWFDDRTQKTDLRSLIDLEDDFATDLAALRTSRQRSLERADYVIPGHGKPFKVERKASSTF